MTSKYQDIAEQVERELTRKEIRLYESYQRKRRRVQWLIENEPYIAGVVAVLISVAAGLLLLKLL